MAVYFHGSFGLNRPQMAVILDHALKNPKLRDAELAKPFGYGAPFAAKTRSWLHKTGIAEQGFPLELTEMGKIVYEKDRKLETLTTQWFMHWELTTDPTRAEAWHYFFHEFLSSHPEFTRDDLINGLTARLRTHSEKHFGPGSPLIVVIARKVIECYTESNALGQLRIIETNGGFLTRDSGESAFGPWDSPSHLAQSYKR